MTIGGAVTLVALGLGLGAFWRTELRKKREIQKQETAQAANKGELTNSSAV
jgi:hypothetical protein